VFYNIDPRSTDSRRANIDLLAPPEPEDKFTYSDMSIGLGMDISIRGEAELNDTKESYDENGWKVGRESGLEAKEDEPEPDQHEEEEPPGLSLIETFFFIADAAEK